MIILTLFGIILFSLLKDTKSYVTVVTLSAKYNRKLSKLLIKGIERPADWNEYKKKCENKNAINK